MTDTPGSARRANEALAERLGVRALSLRVEQTTALTPSCRRIRLSGEELSELDPLPGQDVMVSLDGEAERTRRRRYTIRHLDRGARLLELDIALHGDGPGMRWALGAHLGERVEAIGPRGKITLDPESRWHLFVGDDSFAPAALAMAEAVARDQTVIVVLEIDAAGHEQPHEITAQLLGAHWVPRDGTAPGDPEALWAALATVELPAGPGHAYVGGEHAVVARLREALLERGMEPDAVSSKSYWRLGRQNAANGEPDRG